MIMNVQKITITKLEAAESQINTAIELLFRGGDPISVHTLANAAFQILYDVSEQKGGVFHLRLDDWIAPEKEKEFWGQHFNKWFNFSKHGDKDPDGIIELFDEKMNDTLLMYCCMGWRDHGQKYSRVMNVFWRWFVIAHPNLIKDDYPLKAQIVEFGATANLSREQLLHAGRTILENPALPTGVWTS